ncbi:hypothetical protein EJB05_28919, partial [Eragrostis curvula]
MSAAAPPDAASFPPWTDLPSDLLRDISRCLHTTTNYVRFHAVCRSWRDSLPPPERRPVFLPWLVAPRDAAGNRKARCVFSSFKFSPHRATATEICVPDRRWVTSVEDGTATCWLQANSNSESGKLVVDPLTGSAVAIPLPHFEGELKSWEKKALGVASGDGTIIVYAYGRAIRWQWNLIADGLDIALRHPGDNAEWRLVRTKSMYAPDGEWRRCCVAYRHGRIIVSNLEQWGIVPTEKGPADEQEWKRMPAEPGKVFVSSHLVESGEELLWVFVQAAQDFNYRRVGGYGVGDIEDLARALSVSVFVLHETDGGKPHWVKRDGWSLSDRVVFLGRPSSFAMDAARFGMSGRGCAYFLDRREVYGGICSKSPVLRCRVFKYNFIDCTCELVEQLPEEWADKRCTWLTPRPAIASTEEIRERLQTAHKTAGDHPQQFRAHFRIYVGNLPLKVDNYQLRQLFSKHGNVDEARVMRDRRTGRSRGFGFLTMATVTDEEPADVIAKLNGQYFDGRSLRVKFENQ